MGSPFGGPRHRSWASDTVISAAVLVVLVGITALSDWLNGPTEGPPQYLTGLCAACGAWVFGAASADKGKRDRDTEGKADRAERRTLTLNEDQIRTERKVDDLTQFAREEHPHRSEDLPRPLIERRPRQEPDDEQGTG